MSKETKELLFLNENYGWGETDAKEIDQDLKMFCEKENNGTEKMEAQRRKSKKDQIAFLNIQLWRSNMPGHKNAHAIPALA